MKRSVTCRTSLPRRSAEPLAIASSTWLSKPCVADIGIWAPLASPRSGQRRGGLGRALQVRRYEFPVEIRLIVCFGQQQTDDGGQKEKLIIDSQRDTSLAILFSVVRPLSSR